VTEYLVAERHENIDGFMVPYGILGSTLTFPYFDGHVTVSLPLASSDKSNSRPSCAFSEGLAGDGDRHPETSWYDISELKFSYRFPAPPFLDGLEAVEWNTPEFAVIPEVEAQLRNSIVKLDDASSYWKAMARYVTDSGMVGRSEVKFGKPVDFRQGAKIFRASDSRVFRNHGGVSFSRVRFKLTKTHWKELEARLRVGFQLPLWFEYIYEAERRFAAHDVNGAVLSAAIASESIVRAVLWSKSPAVADETVRRLFDRVSVQAILSRWTALTGIPKSDARMAGKSDVHTLLDLRNDLLHNAISMTERNEQIGALIKSVKKFIRASDQLVSVVSND
jgi:hypothetical protein